MRVQHIGLKIAALAVFAAVCSAIFVYLYTSAGGRLPLSNPYRVGAAVPNAFQLVPNADVRQAGVKIGRVVSIDGNADAAQVKLELDRDQAPIYRDTRLMVRTKTLVGENYLDLRPGTPRAGAVPEGGTLPLRNAQDAVQLDQILSALDGRTRASVRRNLRELGVGVGGAGPELNRLFGAARPTVADGGRLMAILRAQRVQVARLVDDTGAVMQAFGDRTADVRSLARSAKATAVAVAGRDQRLRETIDELPATLRRARSASARLGRFSVRAAPVVRDLRLAARDLGPVVRDLEPTARDARQVLVALQPLLLRMDPLLGRLRTFTTAARPLVPSLDALLRQLSPALAYLAPYRREFGAFFANVGSANDTRDAVGQIARVHPQVSEASGSTLQPEAKKALDAILKAGLATRAHVIGTNPYPKPGGVAEPKPFDGSYPRVQAQP